MYTSSTTKSRSTREKKLNWGYMTWSSRTVSAGTGLPPISRTHAASGPSITVAKDEAWRLASVEMRSPLGVPHFSLLGHPRCGIPRTVYKDVQVALGWPSLWPYPRT